MLTGGDPVACCLDSDHTDVIIEKRMEQAHGIGAAADTRNQGVRKLPLGFDNLFFDFPPDNTLEVTHHGRIRVGPGNCPNNVEGVFDIGDPISERFIHGIFQGRCAACYRYNFGTQQFHAENVGGLTFDVGFAHIDDTRKIKQGADGRRGHTMLAGACFCNDPLFAHSTGKEDLSERIVNLVRSGVVELITLKVNPGSAQLSSKALGKIQRAWTPNVVFCVIVKISLKFWILTCRCVCFFYGKNKRHKSFCDKSTAEDSKMAGFVGPASIGFRFHTFHADHNGSFDCTALDSSNQSPPRKLAKWVQFVVEDFDPGPECNSNTLNSV